jgi:hypothetical protein
MARRSPRLTPQLEQTIVAYIRAGGWPWIAAEAAGVPRTVFDRWMERGSAESARPAYRRFRLAILQAHAQARLGAEVAVLKGKPLDWLKSGPGREAPPRSGWTSAARPPAPPRAAPTALDDPQVQQIFAQVLEALAPWPEARALVAGRVAEKSEDRSPSATR